MIMLRIIPYLIIIGMWFALIDISAGDTKEKTKLQKLEFQDIKELNLRELLDITITIAAGRAQAIAEAPGIVSVVTNEEIGYPLKAGQLGVGQVR